jgi:transcriptional regulator with XRE-family HTH domain
MDTSVTRKKIGTRLKDLRIKAGYTNHDNLAYDTGLTRQTVWRAEKGENLTLDTLLIILKHLKISFEDFAKGIK